MSKLTPKLRNKIYYATGTIAGQRIRQSLETSDKARAEELCALYEAKLWKRHSYGEAAVRTFEEAALSYMEAGGENRYLPPVLKHFKGRALTTITPGDIIAMAVGLYPNASGATRNRQAITPARAVINHAADRAWCPPLRVRQFATIKPKRTARGRDWHDAFMEQADSDGLYHLSAALLFMVQTGARVSEAAALLPDHLDLSNRTALLAKTKTGTWEPRHLTTELVARIANLDLTHDRPVFGYASRYGIYRRMKAVCRRAGLEWSPPHEAGRHSFASQALEAGASVRQVMDAGGFKSARLFLETYAHSLGEGSEVAALFDGAIGTNLAQRRLVKRLRR